MSDRSELSKRLREHADIHGDQLDDANQEFASDLRTAADLIEVLTAERDQWVAMGHEWLDKTEWVQTSALSPRWLGRHRADVLREQIEELTAERDALRKALDALREALIIARDIARDYVAADQVPERGMGEGNE